MSLRQQPKMANEDGGTDRPFQSRPEPAKTERKETNEGTRASERSSTFGGTTGCYLGSKKRALAVWTSVACQVLMVKGFPWRRGSLQRFSVFVETMMTPFAGAAKIAVVVLVLHICTVTAHYLDPRVKAFNIPVRIDETKQSVQVVRSMRLFLRAIDQRFVSFRALEMRPPFANSCILPILHVNRSRYVALFALYAVSLAHCPRLNETRF